MTARGSRLTRVRKDMIAKLFKFSSFQGGNLTFEPPGTEENRRIDWMRKFRGWPMSA
jgi:hypothetical protein